MEQKNDTTKSRRDTALERLRGRHPEQEFADDESMWAQSMTDYDAMEGQLNDYKGREQSIIDMMSADPRSANFLANWQKGSDPLIEMMRTFGPDFEEALHNPEMLDKLEQARKEYMERLTKGKELEAEYDRNFEASLETRDAYQRSHGLSDEQMDEIYNAMEQFAHNAIMGKFTDEMFDMAFKAINHDGDVADAAEEAALRERNTKIKETLRRRQEGDGVAAMGGSQNAPKERRHLNVFDYAEAAK